MGKLILLWAVALAAPANGAVLFNQIGPSYLSPTFALSQDFEPANDRFDGAAIDDFTVAGAITLASVEAVLGGWNGFAGMAGIGGYHVNIYSSRAAAAASMTGDVASVSLDAAQVTVSTPFAKGFLVTAPVSFNLSAGSYFLSVVAVNAYANGEVGVAQNGPNTGNGFQSNPNGGLGLGTTFNAANNTGFAYRINGSANAVAVPEPGSWIIMLAGFAAIGGAMRRRSHRPVSNDRASDGDGGVDRRMGIIA